MKTVATAFYDWLMLDLAELCCETPSDVNHIDSVLVGLSLRLQKLDEEWRDYIEPKYFVVFIFLLSTVWFVVCRKMDFFDVGLRSKVKTDIFSLEFIFNEKGRKVKKKS